MNAYFLTVIDVHWIVEVKSPFMMYLVCYCVTASHKVTLPSITAQVIYTLSWPRYVLVHHVHCVTKNDRMHYTAVTRYAHAWYASVRTIKYMHFIFNEQRVKAIYTLYPISHFTHFQKKIEIKGTETMWIFLHISDTKYSPQKFVLVKDNDVSSSDKKIHINCTFTLNFA